MIDNEIKGNELKTYIIDEATRLGANIIGFAPVERWEEVINTHVVYARRYALLERIVRFME